MGNHFNIVFLLGDNVYYLSKHINDCLQEKRTPTNWSNLYCTIFMKTTILLGATLWDVWESSLQHLCGGWPNVSKGHILDLNIHYKCLVDSLDCCR